MEGGGGRRKAEVEVRRKVTIRRRGNMRKEAEEALWQLLLWWEERRACVLIFTLFMCEEMRVCQRVNVSLAACVWIMVAIFILCPSPLCLFVRSNKQASK